MTLPPFFKCCMAFFTLLVVEKSRSYRSATTGPRIFISVPGWRLALCFKERAIRRFKEMVFVVRRSTIIAREQRPQPASLMERSWKRLPSVAASVGYGISG